MRPSSWRETRGEILEVHLPVIIPGAPFCLQHQLRALDPSCGRHGVHDMKRGLCLMVCAPWRLQRSTRAGVEWLTLTSAHRDTLGRTVRMGDFCDWQFCAR